MKKMFDVTNEENSTADGVIGRGYEIYDEWNNKKLGSRKIVRFVQNAVYSTKAEKNKLEMYIEAFARLFALDLRIKIRYRNLLRCLFLYFPWQRETRAFRLLENALHMPKGGMDIRTAIEIALQKLREKLETEETDGEDDGKRGGKRNGNPQEQEKAAEEKGQENATEENKEEVFEAEETEEASEQREEEKSEQVSKNEEKSETADRQDKESPREKTDTAVFHTEQKAAKTEQFIPKTENNGSLQTEEPSTDKKTEQKNNNDAFDYLPVNEESADRKDKDKPLSFIDEVIMDNMVKGKADFLRAGLIERNSSDRKVIGSEELTVEQSGENKTSEKDDYLDDRRELANKGEPTVNSEPTANKDAVTNNTETSTQESEKIRVPLKLDIAFDQENAMRGDLNNHLTPEVVQAIHDGLVQAMREQFYLPSDTVSIDDPVNNVSKPEPIKINQPIRAPRSK